MFVKGFRDAEPPGFYRFIKLKCLLSFSWSFSCSQMFDDLNLTVYSAVESTDCSSRGPRFNSQHPHNSTYLSVTPVPGDLTPSHRIQAKRNDVISEASRMVPWVKFLARESRKR